MLVADGSVRSTLKSLETLNIRRYRTTVRCVAMLALLGSLLGGCGASSSATQGGTATRGGTSHSSTSAGAVEGAGVSWWVPAHPIKGLGQRIVGHGARAAVLLWREGAPPPKKAVVFLHGWEARPPWTYASWLRHLATEGNAIVYPVYQQPGEQTGEFLPSALAGIRLGLHADHANPRSVVAIGHTTGGALAFDYAASAAAHGLEPPRGVLAVYPGRNPPETVIPAADLSSIPASTWLAVIAGPGDRIPDGNQQAKEMLRDAARVPPGQRRFLRADPTSSGPIAATGEPSREMWGWADRLIAEARGN
ncbi:MAG: hypothetical protein JSU06_06490 [Actinobacteria bacterium]|nr:hypothetical protein [Actinomycetota bacterium]